MRPGSRSRTGFDALVDCVVRELDAHGLTLTSKLVHDELQLMLHLPEAAGGLPEDERHHLLGPAACGHLAERLRARLRLPDLTPTGPRDDDTEDRPDARPDLDGELCTVVDLASRRRRAR